MRSLIRYKAFLLTLLIGTLAITGCSEDLLNVQNKNAPDRERALADASDLVSVLRGGYTSFWSGTYENTPFAVSAPHLHGWGDAMTTTNAFAGFWTVATDEPRPEFQNTLTFADLAIVEEPWQELNSAVSSSNDVIREIEVNDFDIIIDNTDRTQRTLAAAYLLRGLAYGHLANLFNQAYITTEEFDPEEDLADLEFSPYPDVLSQAQSDFEQARQIAQNNSFTLPNVLPFSQAVTSDRLIRLANSFEARHIVSNPRTPDEASNIDWENVRTLARNGLETDLVMDLDGNEWFNNWQYVSGLYWYWRVDNRLVQKMAAQHGVDYPIKYPADQAGTGIDPAKTFDQQGEGDARLCPAAGDEFEGSGVGTAVELGCWFVYDTDQSFFREARGPTLQSNYWYARDFILEQWFNSPFAAGPGPIFLAEENRLMEAEAEIRLGNIGAAADIINNGSRVNVGELEPVPTDDEEAVREAIYYERDIQLYRTGLGLPYFDLRRRGMLQAGTPLHMPVPATELQTIQQELYTFGGVSNAGQPGTASGDNAWCDQGDFSCDGPFAAPNNPPSGSSAQVSAKTLQELGLIPSSYQPGNE